jgi:hypothetical protein
MRFVLRDPSDTRPSLVVHTAAKVDDASVEELRQELYGCGCATGILLDADVFVILRDSFTSMDADSIVAEQPWLSTPKVLAALNESANETFDARVEWWLRLLATRWNHAIPEESELASTLILNIVPAAACSCGGGEDEQDVDEEDIAA